MPLAAVPTSESATGASSRSGRSTKPAARTIDADGRVVAPGFIDVHTHYDAQVFWDPTLSPSPLHGVTTVVGGNCGFTIAPLVPRESEYLMKMLARVEGMPLDALAAGVPWDWTTTAEYFDRIDNTLAVNAGFMVGHCALRRVVMGERSVGNEATEDELTAMSNLLRESLAAGGMGFSSSWAETHNDADGEPVPSRHATADELLALCRVTGEQHGNLARVHPHHGRVHRAPPRHHGPHVGRGPAPAQLEPAHGQRDERHRSSSNGSQPATSHARWAPRSSRSRSPNRPGRACRS